MSSMASSIGIGIWSGTSARAEASSAFSSSITGTSSVRTTIRWLAMPRRTRLGRSCSSNRCEGVGERGRVGDVPVAQDAGAQVRDGAALERQRAVDVDRGGGHVAGVELEPDDGGVGCALSLEHGFRIGMRASGFNDEAGPGGPAS